jgi:hypothetical protein
MDFDRTMIFSGDPNLGVAFGDVDIAPAANTDQVSTARAVRVSFPLGGIRATRGANAGKDYKLEPVIRRIGLPGRQTAAILRRPKGYVIMNVEGKGAQVNGRDVGGEWMALRPNDQIEIGDDQYAFYLIEG